MSSQWKPIGYLATDSSNNKYFSGTFNGNNHYISINNGVTTSGISGFSSGMGIFGLVIDGTIRNLEAKGSISTSSSYTGGIVGNLAATAEESAIISNCINSASINATVSINATGGIAGRAIGSVANASTIINCINKANITGSSSDTGGIVGASNGAKVQNCANEANTTISGRCAVGGISGSTSVKGVTINCCYNKGSISSYSYNSDNNGMSGGIVGVHTIGSITNCYNRGSINSSYNGSGGIAGGTDPGSSTINCYNTGTVTGPRGVGSIAGYSWGTNKTYFTNCWATTSYALIGSKTSGTTISNCGVGQSVASMQGKASTLGSSFKNDYSGAFSINDGYPILYWE